MEFPDRLPRVTVNSGKESLTLMLPVEVPEGFDDFMSKFESQVTPYNLMTIFGMKNVELVDPSGERIAPVDVGPLRLFPLDWRRHGNLSFTAVGEPSPAPAEKEIAKQRQLRAANLRKTVDHTLRKTESIYEDFKKKLEQRAKAENTTVTFCTPPTVRPPPAAPAPAIQLSPRVAVSAAPIPVAQPARQPEHAVLRPEAPARQPPNVATVPPKPTPSVPQANVVPPPPPPPAETLDRLERCPRCGDSVPAANRDLHAMNCSKRKVQCPQCPLYFDEASLAQHIAAEHARTRCACAMSILNKDLEEHKRNHCRARSVKCDFCELSMKAAELAEHQVTCGARTDTCGICGARMQLRDLRAHEDICIPPEARVAYPDYCSDYRPAAPKPAVPKPAPPPAPEPVYFPAITHATRATATTTSSATAARSAVPGVGPVGTAPVPAGPLSDRTRRTPPTTDLRTRDTSATTTRTVEPKPAVRTAGRQSTDHTQRDPVSRLGVGPAGHPRAKPAQDAPIPVHHRPKPTAPTATRVPTRTTTSEVAPHRVIPSKPGATSSLQRAGGPVPAAKRPHSEDTVLAQRLQDEERLQARQQEEEDAALAARLAAEEYGSHATEDLELARQLQGQASIPRTVPPRPAPVSVRPAPTAPRRGTDTMLAHQLALGDDDNLDSVLSGYTGYPPAPQASSGSFGGGGGRHMTDEEYAMQLQQELYMS
eukprot:TRINITY_DN4327_c0_g1_i1.p1 TRINITY_DN4327_c0_g1~~TRINITY_DN4327_c0_g1_i1.p1  ORF type:complete len:708 (+),score=89.05 TRINITY_DN4327_c0_g1_i1:1024-3147(+)